MISWQHNLAAALQDHEVLILHGNVRDRYIDDAGRLMDGLTALIDAVAARAELAFASVRQFDPVRGEVVRGEPTPPAAPEATGASAEPPAAPAPRPAPGQARPPASRVLAKWQQLAADPAQRGLFVVYYLDKVAPFRPSYADEERDILMWLERIIATIAPGNRLVMVALLDTMIPLELYTNSPRTRVLPVPMPGKQERRALLAHRLGAAHPHLDLVTDLTDGLFLRDLDKIAPDLLAAPDAGEREVRRMVNRFRLGEQEDHFGQLSIEKLDRAVEWFRETGGVHGQDEAIEKVVESLTIARAGLSGVASGVSTRPKGPLFFAGPTGVGKTLVARKLALFLFNTEEAFLRFDMSEFKEEHSASKFIGAPPGYVGYERGGMLTNGIRQRPFCVLLFDEIEKAHHKIMDIFLQILDEGRLTDSRGQTVFFSEAFIIFTSNIGTRTSDTRDRPIDERSRLDQLLQETAHDPRARRAAVRQHFSECVQNVFRYEISRPELLNRIGNNIVPFNYIHGADVQRQIVLSHLSRIQQDVQERYRAVGHTVTFAPEVADLLVERYGSHVEQFGGRGITHAVEDELMPPLSRRLLRAEYRGQTNLQLQVQVVDGEVEVR